MPLPWPAAGDGPGGYGALVTFDGIVRPIEEGRSIAGLQYEAYRPMADRMLLKIAGQAMEQFSLVDIEVDHSIGWVGTGECSFRLRIAAMHRKEALAATDWFIDRLKLDVPIWKAGQTPMTP